MTLRERLEAIRWCLETRRWDTAEQHALAALEILGGAEYAWRRSPGSSLQTDPMMGYPANTEHFRLIPEPDVDMHDINEDEPVLITPVDDA